MYDMTLDTELEAFVHGPKRPTPEKVAELAHRFLVAHGEPLDMAHKLVAMKALGDLREQEQEGAQGQ